MPLFLFYSSLFYLDFYTFRILIHPQIEVLQVDLPNFDSLLTCFFFSPRGLSHLVAASFTEDRFGVVQTTLPAILNTLLTLQEVGNIWVGWKQRSCLLPRLAFSVCFLHFTLTNEKLVGSQNNGTVLTVRHLQSKRD